MDFFNFTDFATCIPPKKLLQFDQNEDIFLFSLEEKAVK